MAKNFRELIIWQLGFQLRLQVRRMSQRVLRTERDFVWDIRRSAKSIPSNIAEGHGRFNPGDFHRFLLIAKASLDETENHLRNGLADGDFTQQDYDVAFRLVRRITPAMTRFMKYLRSTQARENAERITRLNQRTK